MNFYLIAPLGTIPYRKLEQYALHRLRFLTRLSACKDDQEQEEVLLDAAVVDNSDCLISGTAKDLISHHILRLLLGGDFETSSFFARSEEALFVLRCDRMSTAEWEVALRQWEKDLNKTSGHHPYSPAIQGLKSRCLALKETFMTWPHLAEELSIKQDESSLSVRLPFQSVLRLVSRREITLDRGMAVVPANLLKTAFAEWFAFVMEQAIQQAKVERQKVLGDARMKRLAAVLKRAYRCEGQPCGVLPPDVDAVQLGDLWGVSKAFPLCMRQVVEALRTRHRLRHHDRIQLTLFLKELGLSVHEALLLWKREYSTPCGSGSRSASSPSKGWQGNERRYLYNIRHLYGLEGGRVDYKAHSCASLQGRQLGCGEVGGCPFVSLDERSLTQSLERLGLVSTDVEEMLSLKRQRRFQDACKRQLCLALGSVGGLQSKIKAESHLRQASELVEGTRMKIKARSSARCSRPSQRKSPKSTNNLLDNLDTVLPESDPCQPSDRLMCQASDRLTCQASDRLTCQASDRLTCQASDRLTCQASDRITCQASGRLPCQASDRLTCEASDRITTMLASTTHSEAPPNGNGLSATAAFSKCQPGSGETLYANQSPCEDRNTEQEISKACDSEVCHASNAVTETGCLTVAERDLYDAGVARLKAQRVSSCSSCYTRKSHCDSSGHCESLGNGDDGARYMSSGFCENHYHCSEHSEGELVSDDKQHHLSEGKRGREVTSALNLHDIQVSKKFKFGNEECGQGERTESTISVSGRGALGSVRIGKHAGNVSLSYLETSNNVNKSSDSELEDGIVLLNHVPVLERKKWSESETLMSDSTSSVDNQPEEYCLNSSQDAFTSSHLHTVVNDEEPSFTGLNRKDVKDNILENCATKDQRLDTLRKVEQTVEKYSLRKPSEYYCLFQKCLKEITAI